MTYQCSEEQFLRDVAQHKMTILRDERTYRHIRFKRDGSSSFYFDLITWPGYLCLCGDMGTYTFKRTEDMFQFFRTDCTDFHYRKNGLSINPGYWGGKLESNSCFGGYSEFDSDYFREVINEYRVRWIRDAKAHGVSKEDRRELWEAVDYEILDILDSDGGTRAQIAAHDFSHRCGGRDYQFDDLWDRTFTRETFHFIWCCYALAWGISKYDAEKPVVEEATL